MERTGGHTRYPLKLADVKPFVRVQEYRRQYLAPIRAEHEFDRLFGHQKWIAFLKSLQV